MASILSRPQCVKYQLPYLWLSKVSAEERMSLICNLLFYALRPYAAIDRNRALELKPSITGSSNIY